MDERMRMRWHAVTAPLGIDEHERDRALDDLAARYDEDHRAYHTLSHVRHMLDVLDFLEAHEDVDDPVALRLAAWLHHAVYDPNFDDNASRSARYAAEVLTDWGVPPERVGHIHALVHATADHLAETSDEAVFVDADLAILASDPETYSVYCRALRVEYAHVDEPAWCKWRAEFCEGMLARDPLYVTATLRRRGEEAARTNMGTELARLEAELGAQG